MPQSSSEAHAPLVWMDLEMSGLDPETCQILEIATVITDGDLQIIADGPDLVIHQGNHVLDAMDAWCTEHHQNSGLSAAVQASSIDLKQAELETLEFIRKHCPRGAAPLCGNSIGQDRRFLFRYMPTLEQHLHYRSVDVSSIKELAGRWYPGLEKPVKKESHRARDDIYESIAELRLYREKIFRRSL